MISFVVGTILRVTGKSVIVRIQDMGYEIFVPIALLSRWRVGDQAELVIYHDIREGINALYGFATWEEREWFQLLLSVSGIGPKTALAFLGRNTIAELSQAIRSGDTERLSATPGIGRKTAERLIVELKEKIGGVDVANPAQKEVILALESLGYKMSEIREVLKNVSPDLPLEEQIKKSLSAFGR